MYKVCLNISVDEKINLEDNKWEDIHVTTGALKMFFRELPEPLFTYTSFNDFVEAISEFHHVTLYKLYQIYIKKTRFKMNCLSFYYTGNRYSMSYYVFRFNFLYIMMTFNNCAVQR